MRLPSSHCHKKFNCCELRTKLFDLDGIKNKLESALQEIQIMSNRLKNKDNEWRPHIDQLQSKLNEQMQLSNSTLDDNLKLKKDFALLYEKFVRNQE